MKACVFGATPASVAAAGDEALRERGVVVGEGNGRLRATYPAHWGHGLGVGWEDPWLMAGWESPLQIGDALAVEKMVLAQDVGTVSFEQNLVVRSDGQELLSTSPARPWL